MLIIHSLTGEVEPITDYRQLQITRKLNGEYSLSFLMPKTYSNIEEYPLVENEAIVEYDGQEFRIKNAEERSVGAGAIKEVTAEHRMMDLIDEFQYDYLAAGEHSFTSVIAHIFDGSNFTYSISGSYPNAYYEKDVGGQNRLSLLQEALNKHGAEIDPDNRHINIGILGVNSDFQFRYKHNTKTISRNVDTNNLTTVLRGYADKNEYGVYLVESTYRSPMADIYGERHGDPIEADDLVTKAQLDERLQNVISDKPEFNFTVEHVELSKQGLQTPAGMGDNIFTIWEPLNIDLETRVIGMTLFPEDTDSNQYEFGTFKRSNGTDIMADFEATKKQLDNVLGTDGKIKYSALEAAVQQATEALQNSMTELEYPEGHGIIARDPNNSNHLVVYNSKGIGVSTNGGQTFPEAITAEGFVLSAGVIGKLKAQNIEVEELISAINDGQTSINGGIVTITNNTDFTNVKNTADSASSTASSAYSKADSAENTIDDWKYANTTEIDGGNIRTGTVTAYIIDTTDLISEGIRVDSSNGSMMRTVSNGALGGTELQFNDDGYTHRIGQSSKNLEIIANGILRLFSDNPSTSSTAGSGITVDANKFEIGLDMDVETRHDINVTDFGNITIGGNTVATKNWVSSNYASDSHTHSQYATRSWVGENHPTFDTVQYLISQAIQDHEDSKH